MLRTLGKTLTLACAGLVLSTTLATATTMKGTVTEVDANGMATVKTEDGKEYKVKGEGWKAGAVVAEGSPTGGRRGHASRGRQEKENDDGSIHTYYAAAADEASR